MTNFDWNTDATSIKGTIFDSVRKSLSPQEKVIEKLTADIQAVEADPATATGKMFVIIGNTAKVTLRYGNSNLKLPNGDKAAVVATDKLVGCLNSLRAMVDDGSFDAELLALADGYRTRLAKA